MKDLSGKLRVIAFAACLPALAFADDVDVRDFGAVGDGRTKNTAAIQKAIDACSRDGGGRVRFAGGTYMTGMVFLKDGVTLDLAPDGTILGSPDDFDYPTNAPLKHLDAAKSPRLRTTALIVADECRNIGITGTGTIDCHGDAFVRLSQNAKGYGYVNEGNGDVTGGDLGDNWTNWRYRRIPGKLSPPRMVLFAGCQDVRVTDVKMVRPAAGWGYWVTDCDRVAFDRVQVLADPQFPNNDGIHVNASRDVSIANCRIVAGDDAIVVRCNCRALPAVKPCERVTVVNCQLTSHANCIRIGWLNDGVVRNCTFSNLTMTDSACGIGFDLPTLEPGMVDFGCEASLYENLVFSAITMDRIYSAPVRVDITSDPFARLDAIRGITFSDLRCIAYQHPNFRLGKGRSVSDVRFRGCSFVKCADGAFPQKWRQVGAAFWYNDCVEKYEGIPGVTFADCTFETRGTVRPPRRLRFGVVSDVHIDGGEAETRKWRTALECFREQKVEAVVVAGDLTEQGLISELTLFAKTWYEVFPDDRLPDGAKVERIFVFGNHDSAIRKKAREMFGNDEAALRRSVIVGNREKVWPELFHEPYAPFYAKDVKGYRFVASHWRSSAPNAHVFEAAELPDYLRTHAAELGKAKPFFFVQHLHPLGTCHGADAWWPDGGTNTTEALKDFPNAVCFSGHSHKALTDVKAVWQGAFTSFGTGSLSYASPLGNHHDIPTCAHPPEGYPVDLRNRSCSTGLLVDVCDGHLNVRRLEFCTRTPLGEDLVVPVPVPTNPPYAFEMRQVKRPPAYAEPPVVKVEAARDGNGAERRRVSFPAVLSVDGTHSRVYGYELTIDAPGKTSVVRRVRSAAANFAPSFEPKTVICDFPVADIPDGARIKVRPFDSFRNFPAAVAP